MKISTLLKYWWILIVAVSLSTSVGILYTYSQPSIYEATSAFIVNPSAIANTRDLISSINTLTSRSSISTTYCGLVESPGAFDQTVRNLKVDPVRAAWYTVSCTVRPNSNILQIRVRGRSPNLARDIAQIIGFAKHESSIGVQELFELQLVEEAVVKSQRVSPRHEINIIAAALVGLFGGVLLLSLLSVMSGFKFREESNNSGTEPTYVSHPDATETTHANIDNHRSVAAD